MPLLGTHGVLAGLSHSLLFLCVSMYVGTGWSLVLFSFPIAPQLTPATYYNQFVPQVTEATQFFTYMTGLMLLCGGLMLYCERRTGLWGFPLGVLLGVVAATALTMLFIIPYNKQMSAGITDAAVLRTVLHHWMRLNVVRVLLWTAQWLCMMGYFFRQYQRANGYGTETDAH